MGVGLCTLFGRLGSALAPQVSALRYVAFAQLPPLIFAAFAFSGAMLVLLLPETNGQRLPDTIEDVEEQSSSLEPSEKLKPKSMELEAVHMNSFLFQKEGEI
ncbi:organic cation transporter-like protein [Elysia marginata]|uniref:Organic cation transporter-like protein n=1 Tax=Elysia marginata TaxID=1093978 RepID=A0AAV4G137_9GAST|nr:organic cation transporter-like protein [Elysia marginata]